jgi:hypothetical protein
MSGADPPTFDSSAVSAAWFDITPGRAERS